MSFYSTSLACRCQWAGASPCTWPWPRALSPARLGRAGPRVPPPAGARAPFGVFAVCRGWAPCRRLHSLGRLLSPAMREMLVRTGRALACLPFAPHAPAFAPAHALDGLDLFEHDLRRIKRPAGDILLLTPP
jgi:hypothetical protein